LLNILAPGLRPGRDPRAQGPDRRCHLHLRQWRPRPGLLPDGLVDDLHLFVYPIALGQGQRLWADGAGPTKRTLKAQDAYHNGVIHLAYGPA
jgi:hypothetical protein